MATEVIYPDGSISRFGGDEGGSSHVGDLAVERFRLLTASKALDLYLRTGMELTRNGCRMAIEHVIAPHTGKTYKRSRKGKEEALADCLALLASLEASVVVYEED